MGACRIAGVTGKVQQDYVTNRNLGRRLQSADTQLLSGITDLSNFLQGQASRIISRCCGSKGRKQGHTIQRSNHRLRSEDILSNNTNSTYTANHTSTINVQIQEKTFPECNNILEKTLRDKENIGRATKKERTDDPPGNQS